MRKVIGALVLLTICVFEVGNLCLVDDKSPHRMSHFKPLQQPLVELTGMFVLQQLAVGKCWLNWMKKHNGKVSIWCWKCQENLRLLSWPAGCILASFVSKRFWKFVLYMKILFSDFLFRFGRTEWFRNMEAFVALCCPVSVNKLLHVVTLQLSQRVLLIVGVEKVI